MLSRRGLIGLLAGAAGAMVLDPEKLLWVPGRKLISIPLAARRFKPPYWVVEIKDAAGNWTRYTYAGDFYSSLPTDVQQVSVEQDGPWMLKAHTMCISPQGVYEPYGALSYFTTYHAPT
jgi:hypothetical protein